MLAFPFTFTAGTHVSGTAIGLGVGVAKEAEVVAVRILDCTGSGTISDTVAALDWVACERLLLHCACAAFRAVPRHVCFDGLWLMVLQELLACV